MARLLGWSAFLALVLVVAGYVPIGGKTVVERLRATRAPAALVESTWRRVGDGWERLWGDDPAPGRDATARASGARAASRPGRAARPGKPPEEHHTEADRNALDRIVAEHAR